MGLFSLKRRPVYRVLQGEKEHGSFKSLPEAYTAAIFIANRVGPVTDQGYVEHMMIISNDARLMVSVGVDVEGKMIKILRTYQTDA